MKNKSIDGVLLVLRLLWLCVPAASRQIQLAIIKMRVVEEKQSEENKEENVSEVKNSYFFDASQENPTYTVNAFLEENVDEVNMKVEQVATMIMAMYIPLIFSMLIVGQILL